MRAIYYQIRADELEELLWWATEGAEDHVETPDSIHAKETIDKFKKALEEK